MRVDMLVTPFARGEQRFMKLVKYFRGLCGLVCPSRTSERGGEGDCVKEGGGEGERERERPLGPLLCHSLRESNFALQRLVKCRA